MCGLNSSTDGADGAEVVVNADDPHLVAELPSVD